MHQIRLYSLVAVVVRSLAIVFVPAFFVEGLIGKSQAAHQLAKRIHVSVPGLTRRSNQVQTLGGTGKHDR